jgi:hypothetical protein
VGATDNDAAAVATASVVAASVFASVAAADEDGFQEICLPPPTNAGDQGPQRG